ncbi:MAG: NHL repeat-containing protein [Planctomycetota bacterium]
MLRNVLAFILSFVLAPAAAAQGFTPRNIWIANSATDTIVEFNYNTLSVVQTFGAGLNLENPSELAFGPDGRLYVACNTGNRVVAFNAQGVIETQYTVADSMDIAFGPDGKLYVLTYLAGIKIYNLNGTFVKSLVDFNEIPEATGMCIGPDGHIFVSSQVLDRVVEFDAGGAKVRSIGADSGLEFPQDVTIGENGYLYVPSGESHSIFVFDRLGVNVGEFGGLSQGGSPACVATGFGRDLFVISFWSSAVARYDRDGTSLASIPTTGAAGGQAIAVAPLRYLSKISGSIISESSLTKASAGGTLTILPGTHRVFLTITNGGALDGHYCFNGSERIELQSSSAGKKMMFSGVQIGENITMPATSSILLTANGHYDSLSRFTPKRFTGTLHITKSNLVFSGAITANKAAL